MKGGLRSFGISDIIAKNCGATMRVQVRAQDMLGDWGTWSRPLQFYLEQPMPG